MTRVANASASRRRRRRRPINLTAVLICVSLCCLTGLFEKPSESPRAARSFRIAPDRSSSSDYLPILSGAGQSGRIVYPYSVIPGGVRDRGELVREINRDPVVAAHYSSFSTPDTRVVRVQDEKLVHVSCRIENRVFWTAKKIRLARGETLITDGRGFARTRCGNQVSVLAQEPTSPEEPRAEAFDTPVVPENTVTVEIVTRLDLGDPPQLIAELGQRPPVLPILVNPPDMNTLRAWPLLYIPPIIPSSPPPYYVETPVVRPDLPGVPEPSTLILLASGLAAQLLLRTASKK